MQKDDNNKEITSNTYWFTFALAVIYILLLGLFTYLFNNPV